MDGGSVGTFGFDAVPAAFGDDVAVCDARRRKILRADHLAHFAVVEVSGHANNGLEEAGLACVGNVETESFVRFVDLRSPYELYGGDAIRGRGVAEPWLDAQVAVEFVAAFEREDSSGGFGQFGGHFRNGSHFHLEPAGDSVVGFAVDDHVGPEIVVAVVHVGERERKTPFFVDRTDAPFGFHHFGCRAAVEESRFGDGTAHGVAVAVERRLSRRGVDGGFARIDDR